jgi:hypothetical protein
LPAVEVILQVWAAGTPVLGFESGPDAVEQNKAFVVRERERSPQIKTGWMDIAVHAVQLKGRPFTYEFKGRQRQAEVHRLVELVGCLQEDARAVVCGSPPEARDYIVRFEG